MKTKKRLFDSWLETGDAGTNDVQVAGFGWVQKTCKKTKSKVNYIKKARTIYVK